MIFKKKQLSAHDLLDKMCDLLDGQKASDAFSALTDAFASTVYLCKEAGFSKRVTDEIIDGFPGRIRAAVKHYDEKFKKTVTVEV